MENTQQTRPKFVKLSKFHKEATNYLSQYLQFKGKFAKLVPTLDEGATRNQRFFMNGVFNFLKQMEPHITTIEKIVEKLDLTGDKYKMNKSVAMVISWDLIQNGFEIDRFMKPSNAASLVLKFNDEIINEFHNGDYSRPKEVIFPRWAKVNTLLAKVSEVKDQLDKECWVEVSYDAGDYDDFINKLQNLNNSEYMVDFHVKDLLAFPSQSPLKFSEVSKNNHIILQDKASCLPVSVSGVLPGMCVLDACSAPGNKSIHLACAMKNKGKLFCNELSPDRFQILKDRCKLFNVKCAQFWNSDFTEISQYDLLDIHTIILDPSCSNSGTTRYETEDSVSSKRIDNLQCVQRKLLNHALCLPNVQVVVYSTCSIHCEENEEIVANALQKFGHKFELADLSETLPGWRTKGLSENPKSGEVYDFSDRVLRTDPNIDCCHGFFVAKFVAKFVDIEDNEEHLPHEGGTENDHLNGHSEEKYLPETNEFTTESSEIMHSNEIDDEEMENSKKSDDILMEKNDSNENSIKKKKKKKKHSDDISIDNSEYTVENEKLITCVSNESFITNGSCKESSKKKKKRSSRTNEIDVNSESVNVTYPELESNESIEQFDSKSSSSKKKKSKRKRELENNDKEENCNQSKHLESVESVNTSDLNIEPPRKKKKKRSSEVEEINFENENSNFTGNGISEELQVDEGNEKKHKKKKKKSKSNCLDELNYSINELPRKEKSKKSKSTHLVENEENGSEIITLDNESMIENVDEVRIKKKKSKKRSLDSTDNDKKKHRSDQPEHSDENGHKKKIKKSKKSTNEIENLK